MSFNSTKQGARVPRLLYEGLLITVISLIIVSGTIGGFVIGRNRSHDAFIRKVSTQSATENATLLSAGNNPLTLFQAVGRDIDDPLMAIALAKMYDVPVGDRDALVSRLRMIIWVPPYRPAPFVGHMARPFFGDDLHINMLGFRDERESYITKPERTVRIFITGGSTAWGSGASSQKNTISYLLEQILNTRVSHSTGYRYEVINAAFPGWCTTQEKLLIQQRLVDMHPDAVVMLSGNNDVHWTVHGRDIRWLYGPMDENYMMLVNEMYKASRHPEWTFALPFSSRPARSDVSRMTARNVEEAAFALDHVHARLIFAFQPNIVSTSKRLTKYEQRILASQNKAYWDYSYQALRDSLGGLDARNYQFLDLSRSFGEIGDDTEMFVDYYHFADRGSHLIAQALANQIDWQSITPTAAVTPDQTQALSIVSFEPIAWQAGQPFHKQRDGSSTLRIIPSRFNKNLLIVFDQFILPTVIGDNVITASLPASRYATKREHTIYVADGVTGETSQSVVFYSR